MGRVFRGAYYNAITQDNTGGDAILKDQGSYDYV